MQFGVAHATEELLDHNLVEISATQVCEHGILP